MRDSLNAREWDTAKLYSSVIASHINHVDDEINESPLTKNVRESFASMLETVYNEKTISSENINTKVIMDGIKNILNGLKIKNLIKPNESVLSESGEIDIKLFLKQMIQSEDFINSMANVFAAMFKKDVPDAEISDADLKNEIKKMIKSEDYVQDAMQMLDEVSQKIYKDLAQGSSQPDA